MVLKEIADKLTRAGDVAVLPHVSADGDALGSSLALALALKNAGVRVTVYLEEEIPLVYSFMPGRELTWVFNGDAPAHKLVVALDTGDTGRLGKRIDIFNKAESTINIDHHNTNKGFAQMNHIDSSSAAVGEIIYQLFELMGVGITPELALCLYVAVSTDTGGFRYSNTTSLTHRIAAELINAGADVADLSQKIFDTTSLGKIKLTGFAAESLELLENGKIALIVVSDEMMRKSGAMEEDCDGIVNLGRNVRGVEVALMLREQETGEIKGNLRSNTSFDVSKTAVAFSGGGHKKAAGFTVSGRLNDVKEKVLEEIRKSLY